jgi:carbon-monoxide dehydrogenase catalytic subunit
MAGHFSQQELAITTGAVEMMIIDMQCVMPSLPDVAGGYHTIVVSISKDARTPGAEHLPLTAETARAGAYDLLARAAENYRRRDGRRVFIPPHEARLVTGWGPRSIRQALGGPRPTYRPLLEAIRDGHVRGLAAIVGCSNPRVKTDAYANDLVRELVRRDVLVAATGCAGIALARRGLLDPRAEVEMGAGLRGVCERFHMPPVLHVGSCLDNARLLRMLSQMAAEWSLEMDLSSLPVAAVVPEWVSEKVTAVASYFVASGVDVLLGEPFHVMGSPEVQDFLEHEARDLVGAGMEVCPDPAAAADRVVQLLDARRAAFCAAGETVVVGSHGNREA